MDIFKGPFFNGPFYFLNYLPLEFPFPPGSLGSDGPANAIVDRVKVVKVSTIKNKLFFVFFVFGRAMFCSSNDVENLLVLSDCSK
jgi:hypothetical protein